MMSQTHDIVNVAVTSRFMHPAVYILILSQHMLQFILSENHENISRNKEARAKALEFIVTPPNIVSLIKIDWEIRI